MGRHSQFLISHPKSLFNFLLSLAAILLAAAAARAQDTTPPAPPPDAASTAPDSQTQSQVRAVRLSDVEGKVQILQGDQVAFDQAEPNMPAVEGMRLVTGDNGRLEIQFEDGSVARVTPDSSIRLTELRRNADGSTVTQIDALTGLSYYELNNRGGQYSVHFGADNVTPVQDAVFRVALDTAPSQLAVMHGAVHVDDGQGLSLDVHPSQTFQTDPQQPGEFTVAQAISADSWDQWNSDRDQALGQLGSNQTTARASSGNPDNPAWNDLDAYGDWYNLPGYGQVWSPSGVGAGWDPFGSGAWGFYPGFGYTWISGYPWGWWPYHCGAWQYLDGWGWIWIPGNCGYGFYGSGWYPYSTVWKVPPGYLLPQRPRGRPVNPRPGQPQPEKLIAVNRGSQFSAPFHFQNGVKPDPRPLTFEGRTVAPLDAGIHPLQRGPMGESFTAALVRTHPEMGPTLSRSTGESAQRSTYTPAILGGARTFGAPSTFNAPRAGGYSGSSAGAHGSFSSSGGASHGGGVSGSAASSGGGHAGGGSVSSGGGSAASAAAAASSAHH